MRSTAALVVAAKKRASCCKRRKTAGPGAEIAPKKLLVGRLQEVASKCAVGPAVIFAGYLHVIHFRPLQGSGAALYDCDHIGCSDGLIDLEAEDGSSSPEKRAWKRSSVGIFDFSMRSHDRLLVAFGVTKLTLRDSFGAVKYIILLGRHFYFLFGYDELSKGMITHAQIRAARALIGWKQTDLAAAAGLSEMSVKNIERGSTDSRMSTMHAIKTALEAAGILFIEQNGHGPGVRLRDRQEP